MMEFINLSTDLRETRGTKDGLYFYRQLTQLQSPLSLEKVRVRAPAASAAARRRQPVRVARTNPPHRRFPATHFPIFIQ